MANIFSFLFGGSGQFTSTKKYEKGQNKERENYLRFIKDSSSEMILSYQELKDLIYSNEYKNKVAELKKSKQYGNSEEKQKFDEYTKLLKSKEIKWYNETLNKKDFRAQKEWEITFEDDFSNPELDPSKWMTGYYWGKALMNEHYVLAGEKQFFVDSNISIHNGVLRLTTKKEEAKGKSWDPAIGFLERDYDYTSALISTGQSFRQKYGKFEAKVRFSSAYPIVNVFWMLGETMLPQIDVFKTSKSKGKELESGVHALVGKKPESLLSTVKGATFKGKYFIYSLEWSENLLVWKINGKEVHKETRNIPNEAMYLTFCTTLPEKPKSMVSSAYMDIDWVRCYKKS